MKTEIVDRLMKLAPETISMHSYRAFAERIAEKAVVVGGEIMESTSEFIWSNPRGPHLLSTTHTALLIDVQPIKKTDPLVEKLRNEYEYWSSNGVENLAQTLKEAADRIEAQS